MPYQTQNRHGIKKERYAGTERSFWLIQITGKWKPSFTNSFCIPTTQFRGLEKYTSISSTSWLCSISKWLSKDFCTVFLCSSNACREICAWYQSPVRVVLKCDWLALTACYCFNSVYRLLVFHFQSVVEATVTTIFCRIVELFFLFSGATDFS